MKIVVTGGKGMLGRTICRELTEHEFVIADLPEADITDAAGFDAFLAAAKADAVIHCAAMTAVDRCETEIDAAYQRHIATTHDDYIDMFSAIGKTERDWRQIRPSWRRLLGGVDVFYAEAKGGKPLPADFKPKGEAVFSIHPDRCMSWPERDAKGAFGLGIPVSEKSAVVLEHRDNDCERIVLRRPFISKAQLAALGSEYELVYIGRGVLSYDALVKVMRAKPHRIDFFLGHLFDPGDPRRKFDFYLSVRRGENGDLLIDRLVAVKLPKKSGKSGRRSSRGK